MSRTYTALNMYESSDISPAYYKLYSKPMNTDSYGESVTLNDQINKFRVNSLDSTYYSSYFDLIQPLPKGKTYTGIYLNVYTTNTTDSLIDVRIGIGTLDNADEPTIYTVVTSRSVSNISVECNTFLSYYKIIKVEFDTPITTSNTEDEYLGIIYHPQVSGFYMCTTVANDCSGQHYYTAPYSPPSTDEILWDTSDTSSIYYNHIMAKLYTRPLYVLISDDYTDGWSEVTAAYNGETLLVYNTDFVTDMVGTDIDNIFDNDFINSTGNLSKDESWFKITFANEIILSKIRFKMTYPLGLYIYAKDPDTGHYVALARIYGDSQDRYQYIGYKTNELYVHYAGTASTFDVWGLQFYKVSSNIVYPENKVYPTYSANDPVVFVPLPDETEYRLYKLVAYNASDEPIAASQVAYSLSRVRM